MKNIFLLVLILLIPYHLEAVECSGKTYTDSTYLKETTKFSIYSKVFLKVKCTGIKKGQQAINTDWISPAGNIVRQESTEFDNDTPQQRTFFLWFKLLRKGPIERSFTSEDFDPTYYGTWKAINYYDGNKVAITPFKLF